MLGELFAFILRKTGCKLLVRTKEYVQKIDV